MLERPSACEGQGGCSGDPSACQLSRRIRPQPTAVPVACPGKKWLKKLPCRGRPWPPEFALVLRHVRSVLVFSDTQQKSPAAPWLGPKPWSRWGSGIYSRGADRQAIEFLRSGVASLHYQYVGGMPSPSIHRRGALVLPQSRILADRDVLAGFLFFLACKEGTRRGHEPRGPATKEELEYRCVVPCQRRAWAPGFLVQVRG